MEAEPEVWSSDARASRGASDWLGDGDYVRLLSGAFDERMSFHNHQEVSLMSIFTIIILFFARLALLVVWILTPLVNRAFHGGWLLPLLVPI